MKHTLIIIRGILLLALLALVATLAVGCAAPQTPTPNPHSPETAIKTLQTHAGLPDLPIQFDEMVTMANSPDGALQVALYKDTEGRKFYVEQKTDQVIELDARGVAAPGGKILSTAELRATAEKLVRELAPGFDTLARNLDAATGEESDIYSFYWQTKNPGDWLNPPYIQIALNVSGELVGYVNTVILPQ